MLNRNAFMKERRSYIREILHNISDDELYHIGFLTTLFEYLNI